MKNGRIAKIHSVNSLVAMAELYTAEAYNVKRETVARSIPPKKNLNHVCPLWLCLVLITIIRAAFTTSFRR